MLMFSVVDAHLFFDIRPQVKTEPQAALFFLHFPSVVKGAD